jgi:DNA primase
VSDFAQTVKQQADIVKVIGSYIRLRKAGAQNYSGLCPFHKEKSPSFSVHAGRQFYHCFGCGQSGDIFSFVSKIENLSFPEAVRAVAQKCGIPLPKREYNSPEEAAEAGLRRKLLDLHEIATVWFEEQLRSPEGALAREYLSGRGVTADAIRTFRIGYAPDNYNSLRDFLAQKFDVETLRASGVVGSKDSEDEGGNVVQGRLYALFRKRIMFPICNESGRVIAFTGRSVETGGKPSGEKAGPKYYNSPATPLYTKGHVLFNLDKAKAQMRAMEFALLVEGQMDCISVFMRGIQNVIATSGTAFTEQQVGLLRRQTTNVVVNFDPDAAGANAAEKSISLLTEEGFTIKVVTLDGGLDPDRFIRERGVEAYAAAIRGARRQSDYLIDRARQQFPGNSSDAKIKQMNYLLPHIRRIPQKLERDQFIHDAAQKLGIDSAIMREEFRQAALKRQDHVTPSGPVLTGIEGVLLRALASSESMREAVLAAIIQQPQWFEHLTSYPAMASIANNPTVSPEEAIEDPIQRALFFGVLVEADRIPLDSKNRQETGFEEAKPLTLERISDALLGLQSASVERAYADLEMKIREANLRGDFAEEIRLAQQRLLLNRERKSSRRDLQ